MSIPIPRIRLGKAIEVMIWLAALSVLAENIILFRQNRLLNEALAPQISAGTQLQMLSALGLDGHLAPVNLLSTASRRILLITFRRDVRHARQIKTVG